MAEFKVLHAINATYQGEPHTHRSHIDQMVKKLVVCSKTLPHETHASNNGQIMVK